ncbi:MAG: hypothetical protein LKM32_14485 [Chiayiivirga sp.]|jgi:hypothetical protein|uniref:hypothetical protein n=1 Tax=Chiayiivirga sp. TaxID=2041042 RepID=UPI0025B80332|nr:hypothetical protein [Chiayiivirga sp.]MCI1711510.1 hypothetical protein [Chiayiivirga sp.]MCI1730536.1 hypothetical protein [Chiayiivirga sp.]
MSNDSVATDREAFIRWQDITRDQFTAVSNLALGLATGLLAFLVAGLRDMSHGERCLRMLAAASSALLAISVVLAVCCAINRLRDFRATARIARHRQRRESVSPDSREETKVLGETSWSYFWWQLTIFGFGAVGTALTIIVGLV